MELSKTILNKFEIEERIEAALPIGLREAYRKIRTIKAEDISERLPSTIKREQHWNNIVPPLVEKIKKELSKTIFLADNPIMSKDIDDSAATTIAEAVREGVAQAMEAINIANKGQNYNHDFELLNKPSKYNGSRDPFIIDNWITSINDYRDFKDWNEAQTFRFARTLLSDIAAIWLRNIESNEDEKPILTWTALRQRIIIAFKPTNSTLIFRERLEELRQTSTISQYIQDFLTLKLGIPYMTDDEAVSKFVRHLKNKDARIQLRGLYRGDKCPSMDEVIQAAYIFESARNENNTFAFLPAMPIQSTSNIIDDPMDLSSLRDVLNYIHNNNNRGNSRGNFRGGFRNNGYRGNHNRGSGNFRGNSFRGNGFRGSFRGSNGSFRGGNFRNNGYQNRSNDDDYNSRETRSCFSCGQIGHLQANCKRNNQELNYMNESYDDYQNYNDYYQDNQNYNNHSNYNQPVVSSPVHDTNNNSNKDQISSDHYLKSDLILYERPYLSKNNDSH